MLVHQHIGQISQSLEIVQRAAAKGQAEMGRLHHIGPDFLLAVLQIYPVQLGTGRHAVCCRAVIELEYIINDFRFFLIKSA